MLEPLNYYIWKNLVNNYIFIYINNKESFNSVGKLGKINNKQVQNIQGLIISLSLFLSTKGKNKNKNK